MKTTKENIVKELENSKGKFFSVIFIKKDGSARKLYGKLLVKKYLKSGKCTVDKSKYIIAFDWVNKGYRSINKDTVLQARVNGKELVI